MSEQGNKHDSGKPRMSLIPSNVLVQVMLVLAFGANKYGEDDWKQVKGGSKRYYDAAVRHAMAWYSARFDGVGDVNDTESGYHHLAHAVSSLIMAMWHDCHDSTDDDVLKDEDSHYQ